MATVMEDMVAVITDGFATIPGMGAIGALGGTLGIGGAGKDAADAFRKMDAKRAKDSAAFIGRARDVTGQGVINVRQNAAREAAGLAPVSTVNNITVDVKTNADPNEIANAVGAKVKDLRDADLRQAQADTSK
jgi:hypothetical protein